MTVSQMCSRNGNPISNQFVLSDDQGNRFFQSYKSIIVKIDSHGKVFLDEVYWNYSTTTGKYRNLFLNENRKTTEKKIKNGTYTLTNLNTK